MENKKTLFEKLMNDVRRIWKTAPRGLILWNLCIVGILIIPAFYNVEVFILAQAVGSFLAFALMLDNDLSGRSGARNLWIITTAFAWVMFAFMILVAIAKFAYKWSFGYLIEQDEIRQIKYRVEQRVKELEQVRLDSTNRKEKIKKLDAGVKNNQNLLGN